MKQEFISQYRAALQMLANTIVHCPDTHWADINYQKMVYHALHYTALYLSKTEDDFIPWDNHRPGFHILGNLTARQKLNVVELIYSKAEMQNYITAISQSLPHKIDEQSLTAPSGFEWIAMNKLELHLYNLRHLQHHVGQLIGSLHQINIRGIDWIDSVH